MTGAVLLIGAGGMFILIGLVILAAIALGVDFSSSGASTPKAKTRIEAKPIYAVAGLTGMAALLLTGWVAVGVGTAGAVVLVPSILAKSGAQERIARLEALGSWTRRLADLLASGAASSLESALSKSAKVAPAPIAAEVALLVSRMGPQGIRRALMSFARDMADPVSDEVVMALVLQLRHGGRGLAAVLKGLAGNVDDQIRMRREVESDRAKPRSNVRTLVLLTLGMSAAMILFARGYLAPYGTVQGQFALAVVVGVFGVALLWLKAMLRQQPGERLLVDADFEPERVR
jgi:hypothetical protein